MIAPWLVPATVHREKAPDAEKCKPLTTETRKKAFPRDGKAKITPMFLFGFGVSVKVGLSTLEIRHDAHEPMQHVPRDCCVMLHAMRVRHASPMCLYTHRCASTAQWMLTNKSAKAADKERQSAIFAHCADSRFFEICTMVHNGGHATSAWPRTVDPINRP